MKIAVASGKGGTGKTTISAVLASYLDKQGHKVQAFDCDVEEPNLNLFLKAKIISQKDFFSVVPGVALEKCDSCLRCEKICNFSAIVMVKDKPLIFPEMCHSCGGCFLVCSSGALSKKNREVGIIEKGENSGLVYWGGKLKIGEAISPPLIKAVKENLDDSKINIIDCPPGTSCPVIEAVADSDYIILVAEPTPFGLHDLKLAVALIKELGINFGVLINKSDVGDRGVLEFCEKEGIEVMASIPNSEEIARYYSKGDLVNKFIEEYSPELDQAFKIIKKRLKID